MITVNAIKCPNCGDTIYSRAHYDCRHCSCGKTFIDGGFDYIRVGSKYPTEVKSVKVNVRATKKELYEDWNLFGDKYGLIFGKMSLAEINKEIDEARKSGKPEPVWKGNKTNKVEKSIKKELKDIEAERKTHPVYYFFHDSYWKTYHFVDSIPLRVRTFIQRGKRGWANSDTWGFAYYLTKVISEGTSNLKDHIHGMPNGLTEGQWIDILNKITNTFELAKRMSEDDLYLIKNKKQRVKWQKSLDKLNKKHKSRDRCMTDKEIREYEEGWRLFKEYFFDLYD